MARYRRSRGRSRRSANYVWQTYANAKIHTFDAPTSNNEMHSGELFATKLRPGLGDPLDLQGSLNHERFVNDHTLERIRGSMSHNGSGFPSTTSISWFPLTIVAVKVPVGLNIDSSEEYPNFFDNSSVGNHDIIYRHDVVCDAGGAATPNWHDVDHKAKRKFEPGDLIDFLFTLRQPFQSTTQDWNFEIAVNLRFLWKLRT